MKLYIQKPTIKGAWTWINEGYKAAWKEAGFDVVSYIDILEIDTDSDYHLMAWEYDIKGRDNALQVLRKAKKAYFYVQPNYFPPPWGLHPNWKCSLSDHMIDEINNMAHVHLWNFGNAKKEYFYKWNNVHSLPLAFDSINYKPIKDPKYEFDICFVGGWADNGYNEKKKIMIDHFAEIKKLDLQCGIFINKNISTQDEANVLFNSKIAINIHDAYSRTLGCNSNERAFKTLGLTGFVISDKVDFVASIFPDLPMAETPQEMANLITKYIDQDLEEVKSKNRLNITNNHSYINRVQELVGLA